VIAIIYGLVNIFNGMSWVTFTPISEETQKYLKVSLYSVTACNFVFIISSILANVAANYFLDKFGSKLGMIIYAIL